MQLKMKDNGWFSDEKFSVDTSEQPECAGKLAPLSWAFYQKNGDTWTVSTALNSGDSLDLSFSAQVGKEAQTCDVQIDIRRAGGKTKMCVTDNPDDTCGSGVYLEKRAEK
jgi:hypothetical protein